MPTTSSQAPARSETHQLFSSCSGLLVQRPGGATCVGLRSAFKQGIDLEAWHATQRPGVPSGELLLATCLGRSVYERGASSDDGGAAEEAAPPACLGVEWLRFREAAMAVHQRAADTGVQVQAAAPAPVLLNARSDDTAGRGAAAAAKPGPPPARVAAAEPSPGWWEAAAVRARRTAEGAVASYFGDHDPFWFAKRFLDRANTNLDAMQHMAAQLAAAAMGRSMPEEDE